MEIVFLLQGIFENFNGYYNCKDRMPGMIIINTNYGGVMLMEI